MRPVLMDFDQNVDGGRRSGTQGAGTADLAAQAERLPRIPGLHQAVLPAAETRGTPRGPRSLRDMSDEQLHIDPHLARRGLSASIRLGDLTKETVIMAGAAVDNAAPNTPSLARASSIYHTIEAAVHDRGPGATGASTSTLSRVGAVASRQHAQGNDFAEAATEMPAPRPQGSRFTPARPGVAHSRPLDTYRQLANPAASPGNPPGEPRRMPPAEALPPAAPPEHAALFDIQNFGQFTTHYHDIILLPNAVILVWNTAFRGTKYFPPAHEDAPDLVMELADDSRLFKLHSTGIVIPYRGYELCVMLLGKVVDRNDVPAQEE